jgi:hypothetical protein
MVGVCFIAEDRHTYQDQWSYLFSNFGITDIWELGESIKVYQPTTKIETAAELPADIPLVVMQPPDGRWVQGTESLVDFVHPDEAIYMFGSSNAQMTLEDLGGRVAEHYVYIPLVKHECFAFSAAYMTLWDRKIKNG